MLNQNTNVPIFLESTIPGGPGVDYPTFSSPPPTSFSCQGLVQGYYADQVSPAKVEFKSTWVSKENFKLSV